MVFAKYYPEFMTATCLEWKPVLEDERHKDIIIDSLRFLTRETRATIYGFVLMQNHFHLIWQMMGIHEREDVQRDFLSGGTLCAGHGQRIPGLGEKFAWRSLVD